MKCLSLRQPYAELLVSGKKTIELRNWNTKCEVLDIDHTKLSIGMIIGKAVLHDAKRYDNKNQFIRDKKKHYADTNSLKTNIYGFKIKNAHKLRHPIPISGKLGFFEVDYYTNNITK